jgi:hypothetical chaperone protein
MNFFCWGELMNNFCGIDFGTSNSSIGFLDGEHLRLARFGNKTYTPSSIFFEFDEDCPFFGEEAIARYIDGREGRMIWSPKNALGTNLINEKTQVKDQSLSFKEIIAFIIANLQKQCERQSHQELDSVVVGRPVFYNDRDRNLDQSAQDAMGDILKAVGFKNIEFAYEPIAAATYYEQNISHEEIALIVDMGGGTSDFTIAKLNRSAKDENKVLAIGGIHIAGTNFDQRLSLATLMPELGLGCRYKTLEGQWAMIPPTLHKELATWHKIGFCYNKSNINYARSKIYSSDEPDKFMRLAQILEQRLGHHVAMVVEKGKIALSSDDIANLTMPEFTPPIDLIISRKQLDQSIKDDVEAIIATLDATLSDARISRADIVLLRV